MDIRVCVYMCVSKTNLTGNSQSVGVLLITYRTRDWFPPIICNMQVIRFCS